MQNKRTPADCSGALQNNAKRLEEDYFLRNSFWMVTRPEASSRAFAVSLCPKPVAENSMKMNLFSARISFVVGFTGEETPFSRSPQLLGCFPKRSSSLL